MTRRRGTEYCRDALGRPGAAGPPGLEELDEGGLVQSWVLSITKINSQRSLVFITFKTKLHIWSFTLSKFGS